MTIAFFLVVKLLAVHAMKENVSFKGGGKKGMNTICRISEKTLPTFTCGMLWPRKDKLVFKAVD